MPDRLPKAEFVLYGTSALLQPQHKLSLCEVDSPGIQPTNGEPLESNGRASFAYFEKAIKDAREGRLDAVVTAPISKFSWNLAGIPYAGHTEYLETLFPEAIMSFFSSRLNLALYSHHIPLQEALLRIKKDPLKDYFLHLFRQTRILSQEFSFLVAGLNPHAGEGGILGARG